MKQKLRKEIHISISLSHNVLLLPPKCCYCCCYWWSSIFKVMKRMKTFQSFDGIICQKFRKHISVSSEQETFSTFLPFQWLSFSSNFQCFQCFQCRYLIKNQRNCWFIAKLTQPPFFDSELLFFFLCVLKKRKKEISVKAKIK